MNVTILLTCAGEYTLNVNRQAAMDLMATYYSDSELTIPWRVKPLAHIDFSRAVTDPCLDAARSVCAEDGEFLSGLPSGLAYNEPYSIRWLGFISPGVADNLTVYTLNLSLAGDDERVKLWIDNSLIVQQWTSLHIFTDGGDHGLSQQRATVHVLPITNRVQAIERKQRG